MSGKGGCLFYLRTKENPQAKVGVFKPEGFPIDYLIILYITTKCYYFVKKFFACTELYLNEVLRSLNLILPDNSTTTKSSPWSIFDRYNLQQWQEACDQGTIFSP
jgi:hypothetical protein